MALEPDIPEEGKKPRRQPLHIRLEPHLGARLDPDTVRDLPRKVRRNYHILLDKLDAKDREIAYLEDTVDDERRLRKEAEERSDTDSLTKVFSRHAVINELEGMRKRRQTTDTGRKQKQHYPTATIIKVDLNDLESFNNLYGDTAGDLAIKHLAKTLKENLRDTDYIARYGGDEFLVILRETNIKEARAIIEVILKKLAESTFEFTDTKDVTHTFSTSGSYGATEMLDNDTRQEISHRLKVDITKHKIQFWKAQEGHPKQAVKLRELTTFLKTEGVSIKDPAPEQPGDSPATKYRHLGIRRKSHGRRPRRDDYTPGDGDDSTPAL